VTAPEKFVHRCVGCGRTYAERRLHCDGCGALLRADYATTAFRPRSESRLFAFLDWLPPQQGVETRIGPAVYRSESLAERLGLRDLSIAFNGYAPEVGAENPTGSFKDFEALPTLLYLREQGIESIVLASAGNTARAFADAATRLDIRVLLVVPEGALDRLWLPIRPSDAVRLIVVEATDDYASAIRLAGLISERLGVAPEGGARNVARRDGMGTAVLEYARIRGDLPAHYIQAVGSGTGGIAAWEASLRLLSAGVGNRPPRLHLAQNAPFTPIHDAWLRGRPIDGEQDVEEQRRRIRQIDAQVLANRTPPYAVAGGVRDALSQTDGLTYAIDNEEAREAGALFRDVEGLPIGPAAAVAVAALRRAVQQGHVAPDDPTLLHITGNNDALVARDHRLHRLRPCARLRLDQITPSHVDRLATRLLG
jgi:cysteate synthase